MKKITTLIAKIILMTCIAVLSSAMVYQAKAAYTIVLASPNPAVPVASICQGALKVPVYSFTITSIGTSGTVPTFTALNFTTTGTYVATDIVKFQVWRNTANNLGTAIQMTPDISINLQPGPHPITFSAAYSLTGVASPGTTHYFWVTTDVGANAVGGHTLGVNALVIANVTTTGPTVTTPVAPSAGGTQTIVARSTDPTSASASATSICAGTPVILTLNAGGGGPGATIKWYSGSCGGTPVGTGNNLSVSPGVTTDYYGRWEDGAPCNYNTICRTVTISVLPSVASPALLIEARPMTGGSPLGNNITVCQFQSIQFTVDPLFGEFDETKRFIWKKNGIVVDSTQVNTTYFPITYTTLSLATGDVITLTIRYLPPPATNCFTPDTVRSQPITVTVTPNQPPTAFLSASPLPADTICRGSQVTYTANVTDAGTPAYNFFLDAVSVQNGASNTYITSATLASGNHTIYCRVTSNEACDLVDPVFTQVVVTTPMILVVNPCFYFVPASGSSGPFYTCGSPFYDSSTDPGANYNPPQPRDGKITFCPATAGQYVTISFTSMALNDAGDRLRIWAGTDTTTYPTPLYTYTGNLPSIPPCGNNITAPAASNGGCLTARFISDGAGGTAAGWVAGMSCSSVPAAAQLPGATCANATVISALPYTVSGHTTQCYINDYGASVCGTYNGEDHVYEYTATGPECTSITISGASATPPILSVYAACPDVASSCINTQTGNSVSQVTFPSAGTYYIVVDETAAGYSSYNLDIQTFGLAPANDLPCNAQYIDLLVNVNGNNYCTGSTSEPGVPSCWTGGTMNTLWYSFTSPASPNPSAVHIRTTPGTIGSTQIALYQGSCSSLTLVTGNNCNQAGPNCASTPTPPSSDLIYSNLTPNTIYYVRVDGRNNSTGNFNIIIADVNGAQPYADGQDCVVPMTVCNSVFTVGDPGFLYTGWVCDFGTSNSSCMFAGERSSAWYVFTTNNTGTLAWRLTPNGNTYVDYDWILMDITSAAPGGTQADRVAAACPGINSGNLPWVRCNISDVILFAPCASSQYQTGMCSSSSYVTTTAFGPSFCSSLNVNANQTFLLKLSNWTQNQRGFTIDFDAFAATSGPSPIAYQNPPSVLYWTAGANTTDWFNPVNWGNCGPPDCNTSAIITTASSFMPVIPSGPQAYCRNLDIKSGASVTMTGTAQLNICGNFVNNGSLIAATTTTVNLQGNAVQYFDGNMIGSSSFPILSMSKGLNNMTILDNARIAGSLSLANGFGGKIITGPKELYITNGASGASNFGSPTSFVQGNLRRNLNGGTGLYYFPVGYAAPYNWQLASVNFTATHTIPNILSFFTPWSALPGPVNVTDAACNWNYNVAPGFLDNGYWTLTASANASSATYDMTLFNLNQTNAFAAGSGFTVMKAATSAGGWGLNGTCFAASTAAQTKRTGMTGFSVFATGQTNNPLPITLLNFDAVAHGTGVMTSWVTAAEINNDYFVIERSSDGSNFEPVGTRKGAGNSTTTLYYSMLDLKPHKGVSYYRLRQYDFDGTNTKSELVAVSFLGDNILNVFPNPANTGSINMSFVSAAAGDVKLEIIDMLGKVLLTQVLKVTKGPNEVKDYNIRDLPQGVYFVQLKPTGSEIIEPMQTRLVKQIREE